jgi:hypothetical protein
MRGLGWMEFILPGDAPRLLAWLIAPDSAGEACEFDAMDVNTGTGGRFIWCKLRLDADRWLVFIEQLHATILPGPPGIAGDFAPPAEN